MGGLDEALGFQLVREASLSHPFQDFGEAGQERDWPEVGEGGGGRRFGDRDHDRSFPLWWEEGAVEGVGAEEDDVIEKSIRGNFEDEVGQLVFSGGRPFLDGGEGLLQLRHGVGAVDSLTHVGGGWCDVRGGAVSELLFEAHAEGGDFGFNLGRGRVRDQVVREFRVMGGRAGAEGFVTVEEGVSGELRVVG